MLNVVIMLKVWGHLMQGSHICVHCDNMAVVQVAQAAKTKDDFLAPCLRNIWLITSKYDIDLDIEHIEDHNNFIAHALARLSAGNKNFHNKF